MFLDLFLIPYSRLSGKYSWNYNKNKRLSWFSGFRLQGLSGRIMSVFFTVFPMENGGIDKSCVIIIGCSYGMIIAQYFRSQLKPSPP